MCFVGLGTLFAGYEDSKAIGSLLALELLIGETSPDETTAGGAVDRASLDASAALDDLLSDALCKA